ncbi:MAG: twin-arginine translocase subunit TatC [Kiritimatiellia bacterium]|jgi:sec-independent protein translocase protein TatC
MAEPRPDTFLAHLEELRRTLLACFASWALALPVGLALAPRAVSALTRWSCPESLSTLHYFSPLEVFIVHLRMGCVIAAALCYPYAMHRLWKFLLPALYDNERQSLRIWIVYSSVLFLVGGAFCVAAILPLLMKFSASFATTQITPVIGIAQFMSLAGALVLAFGVMFQTPIAVCALVKFGVIGVEKLKRSRPYTLIAILVVAAILTPPDVLSQIMLALPTWLLFEVGIFLASRTKPVQQPSPAPSPDAPRQEPSEPPQSPSSPATDDAMLSFYEQESSRTTEG